MTSRSATAGARWRDAARRGASGAALGVAIQASSAVATLLALGDLRWPATGGGAGPAAQIVWSAQLCLIAALQELIFRGWLLQALAPVGFWPAASLTGVAFAAIHLGRPGETPAGLSGLLLFSLLAAAGARRTGTVWWAAGFHAAWNVTQNVVLGAPDSGLAATGGVRLPGPAWLTGGSAGPEGGAPALLLMGLALLTLAWPCAGERDRR